MTTLYLVFKTIHIVTAILMAWPFYALVIVNQRARLRLPLGDQVDVYMESIIKNRAVPCLVFQATVLISGLAMVFAYDQSLTPLFQHPILGVKFALLLLISSLLSYVHFYLQPQIDRLFAQSSQPIPEETGKHIGQLRLRRKRLACVCLSVVLLVSMLGVQVWRPFPLWLTMLLIMGIAAFVWRAYRIDPPYGWV